MKYWVNDVNLDIKAYVYFDKGSIHLYDDRELVTKGIFKPLSDIKILRILAL
ncbi:hypothetical protein [Clostridium tetani]|uniref:hypothetical protein n=1 Tax=Clostridium tetani TaxID=1513 RepID=UPI0013E999FD|nr:hypothetical protein [Clostridium tetani]